MLKRRVNLHESSEPSAAYIRVLPPDKIKYTRPPFCDINGLIRRGWHQEILICASHADCNLEPSCCFCLPHPNTWEGCHLKVPGEVSGWRTVSACDLPLLLPSPCCTLPFLWLPECSYWCPIFPSSACVVGWASSQHGVLHLIISAAQLFLSEPPFWTDKSKLHIF